VLEKLEVDTVERNWEYKIKKQGSQSRPCFLKNIKIKITQFMIIYMIVAILKSLYIIIITPKLFFVNKKLGFFLVFLFDIRIYNMENFKKKKKVFCTNRLYIIFLKNAIKKLGFLLVLCTQKGFSYMLSKYL